MKVKYFSTLVIASIVGLVMVGAPSCAQPTNADPCAAEVDPCAAADPCAANPCAAADPCAADPCAANPCAANPCAGAATEIPMVYSDPAESEGIAIRGYDPVAYFTEGAPVEGSSEHTYGWNGVTWQFSSSENQQLFASNPEAYAPQYGGYCAKAMSEGNVVSTVPEAWAVVDDKLYLNYSLDVQQQWQEDIPGNITLANAEWPEILGTADSVWYDTVGAVEF